MEQNPILESHLTVVINGDIDHIAVLEAGTLESIQGDVGPQVTEVGVIDLKVALYTAGLARFLSKILLK